MSITTLCRWEASGQWGAEHTPGGQRRYDLATLKPELFRAEAEANRRTIAYGRVSSHDQRDDLERQKQVLELYCARQGWTFEQIRESYPGIEDDDVRACIPYGAEMARERNIELPAANRQ